MLSQINLFQLTLNELMISCLNIRGEENIFFLGGGSNVLFSKDYNGTIIHISIKERNNRRIR